MKYDDYPLYIRLRRAAETVAILTDECRKKDAAIAALQQRVDELERDNTVLKAACAVKDEALRKAGEELGVYHALEEERHQCPCQPSYAMVLIDAALSSDAARAHTEYVKRLEEVVEAATHVWRDRTYEGGWMEILGEKLDVLASKPD